MNHIYRLVWNAHTQRYQPAPETARGHGKSTLSKALQPAALVLGAAFSLPACIQAAPSLATNTLPTGAQVVAGQAAIAQSGSQMTVNQGSSKAIIDWNSFHIGSGAAVQFIQPSSSAVTLNRVIAGDASQIHGKLSANGQVWLVNPNGVLFGQGSKVDVGGLVVSTLNISNADFLAGKAVFNRNGATGSIVNQGEIKAADGGLVALLAPTVRNEGIVRAQLGSVAMAAGDKVTLQAGANGLLQVAVDPATVRTLVENQQLIVADGGQVVMTGKAANALSASVVSNSGTIQARTLAQKDGRILLLADMEHGEVRHSGLLDASAPNGGNGGFVETSAAKVTLAADRKVTTLAAKGKSGTWLIDPTDFTIGLTSGDITGRQLSADLNLGNVIIQSSNGNQAGFGDINVNAPVSWSADTTLALRAQRYVNINADLVATGNNAGLVLGSGFSGNPIFNRGARISLSGGNASLKIGLSGTEQSYHLIHSLDELQAIATTPTGNYALVADIDASATASWNGGTGFNPIGNATKTFVGNFNGLGHTITNLSINRSQSAVGLFGVVTGGKLSNFGMVGARVIGGMSDYSYIYGIGAIAGYASQTEIDGVYAEKATLSGSRENAIGGLVGVLNGSRVSNSYSTGNITAAQSPSGLYIGGLVGAAYNSASILNSYTQSNIRVSDGDISVGALLGYAGDPLGGSGSGNPVTLVNNYAWNSYVQGGITTSQGIIGGSDTYIPAPGNYFRDDWAINSSTIGTPIALSTLNTPGKTSLNLTDTWSLPAGAATPVLQKFQRDAFVFVNDASKIYDGQAMGAPSATTQGADTSGTLSYSGSYQGAVNAGSYTITPSGLLFPTNTNTPESYQHYGTIYYVPGTLTIDKAPLTVTANSSSKTYDGLAWNGTPGVNYSGFVNGENSAQLGGALQYGGSANGAQNAGSYHITPTGLSSSNYAISYVDGNLSILPRAITVQVGDQTRAYGNANASSGSLSLFSGTLAGSDVLGSANVSSLATASSNAGQSYALNASNAQFTTGNANNYDISYRTGTLTIAPRAISLQPQDATRVYGASNPGSGAWAVVAGSLVNGDSLGLATLTSDAHMASNAGQSYALTSNNAQFAAGNASNYQITYQSGSLTITKAPLTIAANNSSKTYDGLAWSGGNGVNYSGFVNGEGPGTLSGSLVYGGNAQGARNAGLYTLTPGGLSSDNYAITFVNGLLTVTPAALIVTTGAITKTYDSSTAANGTAIATGGTQLFGNDTLSGGNFTFADKNAGTGKTVSVSDVTVQDDNGGRNYIVTYANNTASTINKATLSITTSAVSKTYDGATAANGFAIVNGGTQLFGSDSLSGGSFAFVDKNAGNGKTVTASGVTVQDGNGGNNYAVTYTDNTTSTINKAALTVTTGAATKTYDGSTATNGTASVSSGQLFGADTLSGGTFIFDNKNVGTGKTVSVSDVTVQDGNGGNNYAVTYADNPIGTIHKATLTAKANSIHQTYDGQAFSGGNGLTFSGFAPGDDASMLSGSLRYSGNAQGARNAGNYTLAAAGLDSANYDVHFVDGLLTISPAALHITSSAVQKTYDGSTSANGTALVYSGQLFDTDRLSGGSFAFRDKNAGNSKAVSISGVSIEDGNGGHNYTISYVDNQHSMIERAPLQIAVQDAQMIAGGHAPAGNAFVVAEGQLQNGETVQQIRLHSLGLTSGATAGRYLLEASDAQGGHGFNAANYDIRYAPAWLTVTAPLVRPIQTVSLPDGGLLGSRTQPDLPLQQRTAPWTAASTTGNPTFLSLAPDFIRIEGEP